MDLKQAILQAFDEMSDEEIIALYNEIAIESYGGPIIWPMSELDDQLSGYTPTEIINNLKDDFNIMDPWFVIDDHNWIVSFNSVSSPNCPASYFTDLANYIIDADYAFGNAYIQDVLDEYMEGTE